MKLPLNEVFVRAAMASGLEEQLVLWIGEEIDSRQAGFMDREAFFAGLSAVPGSAKGYWSRAVKNNRIKDPRALVKFLRLLRPAIEIDSRMEPWNGWRRGSRVIVFVGERDVSIPKVSEKVRQRVVGARDSRSFAELAKIMYRDIGLDCEVVLEHATANLRVMTSRISTNYSAVARLCSSCSWMRCTNCTTGRRTTCSGAWCRPTSRRSGSPSLC